MQDHRKTAQKKLGRFLIQPPPESRNSYEIRAGCSGHFPVRPWRSSRLHSLCGWPLSPFFSGSSSHLHEPLVSTPACCLSGSSQALWWRAWVNLLGKHLPGTGGCCLVLPNFCSGLSQPGHSASITAHLGGPWQNSHLRSLMLHSMPYKNQKQPLKTPQHTPHSTMLLMKHCRGLFSLAQTVNKPAAVLLLHKDITFHSSSVFTSGLSRLK